MPLIKVYTKNFCAYCTAAKSLLTSQGYDFEEINLEGNFDLMRDVMEKSGQRTMPQIFVGDHSVGGYVELRAATSNGDFAALVAASSSEQV